MSNNGRYTLCPYYRDEKNKSISCEDTFRTFRWKSKKKEWMDTYCDKDWSSCPYAQDLTKMYEAVEKGDTMAEENHLIEALQKENKNLASKLGRAERRLEPKEQEIKRLRKLNKRIEDMYFEEHRRLNNARKEIDDLNGKSLERLDKEIKAMVGIYEDRMCYMLYKLGGSVKEKDIEEWSKGKEFAITYDVVDGDEVWKVVMRDVPKKK